MTSPSLTIDTPAGPVHATASRDSDAVVFELGGAMRGSVYVTGTHHPHHWDQFTAVRACLGPVNAYTTTAPDEELPRLAHSRTSYHGSLILYPDDYADRPHVSVRSLSSAADHPPSEKTAAVLTAVLRACAEHVAQRTDLPEIQQASRQRDTPGLLRFLTWSVSYHQAEAVRLEQEAEAARPARRAAVAAWWTVARWFLTSPHPVLLLMLADLPYSVLPNSLARTIDVNQWWAPYCVNAAAEAHERARRAQAEADSLRAQQRRRPRGRRPSLVGAP